MICKNCGAFVFKRTKNQLCSYCYTGKKRLEKLPLSVKAWDKLDTAHKCGFGNNQELILESQKYDIVLPDYDIRTTKEKTIGFLKKFNKTNLNKGIDTMQNGIESFSTAMDKMKMDESQNKKILKALATSDNYIKSISFVTGKTKQKDISIIAGKRKSII